MITSGLDHILLAVPNLESARAEFESLGFRVTPGAQHERFGTANYLCVFGSTYLELISIRDPDPPERSSIDVLAPCIAAGGGVPMLALATTDAVASLRALAARGVEASEPVTWSRTANTPEGPRKATFTTVFPRSEVLPGLVAFFCQHQTPQHVRCAPWQRHHNGATDIVGMELDAPGPLREIEATLLGRLGSDAVQRSTDCLIVPLGRHYVTYKQETPDSRRRITVAARSLNDIRSCAGTHPGYACADAVTVALGCARGAMLTFIAEPHQP